MSGGAGTRLTTWPEVHAYLAATYGGSIERNGSIEVSVPSPRTATEPASAFAIEVRPQDGTWLELTCMIGSLRHLSPAELLAQNARAVIGAHCTRDGQLALRQRLPLVGLHVADLDETVRSMAQLAAATQRRTRDLAGA